MKQRRRFVTLLAVVLAAVLSLLGARAATAGHKRTTAKPLVIWADSYRQKAVTKIADAWAASRGVQVSVVVKAFGNLRSDLATVSPQSAPDIELGASDWTDVRARVSEFDKYLS